VPRLNVPERHRPALLHLLSLSSSDFDLLVSALAREPSGSSVPLRLPETPIPGINKKTLDDITSAIGSFCTAWANARDVSADRFARDLAAAVTSFDATVSTSEAHERFRRILEIDSIAQFSKASSILTDNQRNFHEAKILTDIRLAFKPDPSDEPYGAVIIHFLEIVYHEGPRHEEFHIALDGDDLKSLILVLQRAQKKASKIRKKLDAAQIHYLGKGDE
jgi:hypothetical protein